MKKICDKKNSDKYKNLMKEKTQGILICDEEKNYKNIAIKGWWEKILWVITILWWQLNLNCDKTEQL